MKRYYLLPVFFFVLAFSLGTWLQPRMARNEGGDNVFKIFFGEGRRMFANHFAVKADVYLHSGFYPSIFDQAAEADREKQQGKSRLATLSEEHGEAVDHSEEHAEHGPGDYECDTSFMGPPLDLIEALGRNFMITEHSHLEGAKSREILPWLRIAVELDPQRIETYVVGAYWLRVEQKRDDQAEQFLREGLRANPESYEILFELGRIMAESHHDVVRARNLWTRAFQMWTKQQVGKEEPDYFTYLEITVRLGKLEQEAGHYAKAIEWLELAKQHSPQPAALQEQIDDIRKSAGQ